MATMNIELMPFDVPNSVTLKMKPGSRNQGFLGAPEIMISELDKETIDNLVEEFRRSLYKKANVPNADLFGMSRIHDR